MADAFEAEIGQLAGEINQRMARIRETYEELSVMEHTARSADGMVSVTVGRNGQLRGIDLNPGPIADCPPPKLADAIMRQAAEATTAISEQSKELMKPLMPEGLPYEEIFGESGTLDAFFPAPVEPAP